LSFFSFLGANFSSSGSGSALPIRIRIQEIQLLTDPHGSGSETLIIRLIFCVRYLLCGYLVWLFPCCPPAAYLCKFHLWRERISPEFEQSKKEWRRDNFFFFFNLFSLGRSVSGNKFSKMTGSRFGYWCDINVHSHALLMSNDKLFLKSLDYLWNYK
jgi:hypothetical protein